MRVLVCGGRKYSDYMIVNTVLLALHTTKGPITVIIQGGATGADRLGKDFAVRNKIEVEEFVPAWGDLSHTGAVIKTGHFGKYDALAGHRRNQKMLDEGKPDLVVAFKGGTGTADMVGRSKRAGIEVLEVK